MDPATLLIAATAMQAVGAITQANSQASALNNQAQASDYNAAVSKQQADNALQVSTAQQLDQRRKARQILGAQRAAAAQAGVGLGGQTDDLLERSETLAELDALNIAYDGAVRARGFSTQAELDTYQASAYRSNARSVRTSGYLSAAAGVAGGALKLSEMEDAPPARSTVGVGYFGGIRPGASTGLRSTVRTSGLRFG